MYNIYIANKKLWLSPQPHKQFVTNVGNCRHIHAAHEPTHLFQVHMYSAFSFTAIHIKLDSHIGDIVHNVLLMSAA